MPKTEVVKEIVDAAKDAAASPETKSLIAKLCSCMGGSAAPKDTDKPVKEVVKGDAEKEDVEAVPAVVPAVEEA